MSDLASPQNDPFENATDVLFLFDDVAIFLAEYDGEQRLFYSIHPVLGKRRYMVATPLPEVVAAVKANKAPIIALLLREPYYVATESDSGWVTLSTDALDTSWLPDPRVMLTIYESGGTGENLEVIKTYVSWDGEPLVFDAVVEGQTAFCSTLPVFGAKPAVQAYICSWIGPAAREDFLNGRVPLNDTILSAERHAEIYTFNGKVSGHTPVATPDPRTHLADGHLYIRPDGNGAYEMTNWPASD